MIDVYLKQSFIMVCICSGIPLLFSSFTGLLVAVIQTATSIQEQTITYIVKFISIAVVIALLGDWFASELIMFVQEMFRCVAFIGRT